MGQHSRFPGGFLLVAALLALPTLLYGFVTSAEKADKCAEFVKTGDRATIAKSELKCE